MRAGASPLPDNVACWPLQPVSWLRRSRASGLKPLLRRLPTENAAAAELVRAAPLLGNHLVHRRSRRLALEHARLRIEAADRLQLLLAAELRVAHRGLEHADGLVEHARGHGEGVAILAAVRQREARGIGEAAGRAV